MITIVNKEQFYAVIQAERIVLVDVYADWCGPCKMMLPILEEVAAKFDGPVKFIKLNADEEGDLVAEYGIMSIPTLMIFFEQDLVAKMVGFYPKERIIQELNKLI